MLVELTLFYQRKTPIMAHERTWLYIMNKKLMASLPLAVLLALSMGTRFTGILADSPVIAAPAYSETHELRFSRNFNDLDYSDVRCDPWDVSTASAQILTQPVRPYTVMVYMNGSDLETENGAATDDILEMLNSGLDTDPVNIIIFTGGANRWQNNLVPSNNCVVWRLTDGGLEELAAVGLRNMGDPGTLSSFIEFCQRNFPAEKYGLIMWDHGGGSIAGYGHDEKFYNGNLTLLDMNYAFELAGLRENKLEFLGFDSCLMATVEMAVVASDYARYLIASEDTEPGEGWDYSFLHVLNEYPNISGAELGIIITDYFFDFYGPQADLDLTLSVIDLSRAHLVMDSLGGLMSRCLESLDTDALPAFRTLAKKRVGTKTFGESSTNDNECDMVDAGDAAIKLYDMFPDEAARVLYALDEAVIYNRHNSDTDLHGLSAFYIYSGKRNAEYSLPVYESLYMDEMYTDYLRSFAEILNSRNYGAVTRSGGQTRNESAEYENIIEEKLTVWQAVYDMPGHFIQVGYGEGEFFPFIKDSPLCMRLISQHDGRSLYAVHAELNERDCDIIILFNDQNPSGTILGARQKDGFIIQKGFDHIKDGDKIAFYHTVRNFDALSKSESESEPVYKSLEITVDGSLSIEWRAIDESELYYSFLTTDIWNNENYSPLFILADETFFQNQFKVSGWLNTAI